MKALPFHDCPFTSIPLFLSKNRILFIKENGKWEEMDYETLE